MLLLSTVIQNPYNLKSGICMASEYWTVIWKVNLVTCLKIYYLFSSARRWPGRVLPTTTHILRPARKNLNKKIIFLRNYFRDFFRARLRASSNHYFLVIPLKSLVFRLVHILVVQYLDPHSNHTSKE